MQGKKIICFGDSNTWGYSPRTYFEVGEGSTLCWPNMLAHMGWEVVNCGMNGRCVPTEGQYQVTSDLINSFKPFDLVIIMLGTNDILQYPDATPAAIAERMRAFLLHLYATVDDIRILLIAPPKLKRGEWVTEPNLIEKSAELGDRYKQLARSLRISFIDASKREMTLYPDGVHMTPGDHGGLAHSVNRHLSGLFLP